MNDQTNMAQLRYLEGLKISLVHAGFEPERIEDQHLPVRWENHYLCRVSSRYRSCAMSGLEGDYRILADFGDAVLAGHPSERGVRFVT